MSDGVMYRSDLPSLPVTPCPSSNTAASTSSPPEVDTKTADQERFLWLHELRLSQHECQVSDTKAGMLWRGVYAPTKIVGLKI